MSLSWAGVQGGGAGSVGGAAGPAAAGEAVNFEVFGQVVTAGELLLTDDALVRFDSGVRAPVP